MSLEEKVFLRMTINLNMGRLPLLSEDLVVLQNCLLNLVGGRQDFLSVLLGVCLNPPDLSAMGPPLNFCVINLWERIS